MCMFLSNPAIQTPFIAGGERLALCLHSSAKPWLGRRWAAP